MQKNSVLEVRKHLDTIGRVEQDMNPLYYFAYGMLTNDDVMMSVSNDIEKIGAATLTGYKLELLGHANIVPDTGQVIGVLWKISGAVLKSLDRIEGYPNYYTREKVSVVANNKSYDSLVYVMTKDSRKNSYYSIPTNNYVQDIATGYRSAGIPLRQLKTAINELYARHEQ